MPKNASFNLAVPVWPLVTAVLFLVAVFSGLGAYWRQIAAAETARHFIEKLEHFDSLVADLLLICTESQEAQRSGKIPQITQLRQKRNQLVSQLSDSVVSLQDVASRSSKSGLRGIETLAIALRSDIPNLAENRNSARSLQSIRQEVDEIHQLARKCQEDMSRRRATLRALAVIATVLSCLLFLVFLVLSYQYWRTTGQIIGNYLHLAPEMLQHAPSKISPMPSNASGMEQSLDQFIRKISIECASRENFVATMSHEIRTPMNGIIGFLSNLKETSLNDQQQQFLRIIESSARSLMHTITEILDFSKIRSGQMTLEEIAFDLRSLAEERTAVAKQLGKGKALKVILDFAGNDPVIVRTDPSRLRQVIDNLLSNAVKFTERGDIVFEITDTLHDGDRHALQFAVKDSGIGIPLDLQAKIFRPFEQANASISRQYGGTGLGLPISASLVNLLGGELQLKSRPGEGSCFRFTLDLPSARPEEQVRFSDIYKITLPRTNLKKHWALLVDDTPTNLFLLETICQSIGLPYRTAENGREAVQLCRQQHFDVIFMDIQMPIMNGYTAIREIRKLPDSGTTAIIALTASAFQEDIDQALGAGSTGFIPKPFERDQLLICIADALGIQPQRELRETSDYQETAEAATVRRMHDFMQSQYQLGLGEIKMILAQTLLDWRPQLDNLGAYSQSCNQQESISLLQRLKGQLAAIGLLDQSEQTVVIMATWRNGDIALAQSQTAALIQNLTKIFKLLEQNVTVLQ